MFKPLHTTQVPVGGPLQSPVINLANGTYHTAGAEVRRVLWQSMLGGLTSNGPNSAYVSIGFGFRV